MKLRAVYNGRFGQWKLCHDQPCAKGETSVVATVLSGLDPSEDERWAKLIVERFNAGEAPAPNAAELEFESAQPAAVESGILETGKHGE